MTVTTSLGTSGRTHVHMTRSKRPYRHPSQQKAGKTGLHQRAFIMQMTCARGQEISPSQNKHGRTQGHEQFSLCKSAPVTTALLSPHHTSKECWCRQDWKAERTYKHPVCKLSAKLPTSSTHIQTSRLQTVSKAPYSIHAHTNIPSANCQQSSLLHPHTYKHPVCKLSAKLPTPSTPTAILHSLLGKTTCEVTISVM